MPEAVRIQAVDGNAALYVVHLQAAACPARFQQLDVPALALPPSADKAANRAGFELDGERDIPMLSGRPMRWSHAAVDGDDLTAQQAQQIDMVTASEWMRPICPHPTTPTRSLRVAVSIFGDALSNQRYLPGDRTRGRPPPICRRSVVHQRRRAFLRLDFGVRAVEGDPACARLRSTARSAAVERVHGTRKTDDPADEGVVGGMCPSSKALIEGGVQAMFGGSGR
jgi:hypothetical protein